MNSSISAPVWTMLFSIWHTYTWLIDAALCCLLVWVALKSFICLYRVGVRLNVANGRTQAKLPGKLNGVECSPVIPPFHPNAPAPPYDMILLDLLSRFLDRMFNRLTAFSQTLFGMVPIKDILQCLIDINNARRPLNTRLNRGSAQMSALRDRVVAHQTAILRYLCPAIFSCFLFVGLGVIVGISIELAILMCTGALVLITMGDLATGEEDGSNLVPQRARAGVLATLFAWAGVL